MIYNHVGINIHMDVVVSVGPFLEVGHACCLSRGLLQNGGQCDSVVLFRIFLM